MPIRRPRRVPARSSKLREIRASIGRLHTARHPAWQRWFARRRQVSWLAGQRLRPRLPESEPIQWHAPLRDEQTSDSPLTVAGAAADLPSDLGPARTHGVPFSPARAGPSTSHEWLSHQHLANPYPATRHLVFVILRLQEWARDEAVSPGFEGDRKSTR